MLYLADCYWEKICVIDLGYRALRAPRAIQSPELRYFLYEATIAPVILNTGDGAGYIDM